MDTLSVRRPWREKLGVSFSLGELIGLVAGFALAFAFWPQNFETGWFFPFNGTTGVIQARMAVAALLLIPVVLAPVVVAQRARFGDLPRPAEWLLLAMAACRLAVGLQDLEGQYSWIILEKTGGYVRVGGLLFQLTVKGLAMLLFLAGVVAFLATRRRLSPSGAALAVFLLGLVAIAGPIFGLGGELSTWLLATLPEALRPTTYEGAYALRGFLEFPILIVFAVPVLAALRDRGRRAGRRWMEVAGVILAIATAAIWLLDEAITARTSIAIGPATGFAAVLETSVGLFAGYSGILIAAPLAWWLVSRYRSRWDGWLGKRYYESSPGPLLSEA